MSLLQSLRSFNRYRKTERFKNKAYRATMVFLLATSMLQAALFLKPIPNLGRRGVEVDQGET